MAKTVVCAHCKNKVRHYYHWFEGCECPSDGGQHGHRSGCPLKGCTLQAPMPLRPLPTDREQV